MLVLCRISIVVLHLLLLSHIAHTFVLLTANVDDVKKIARKFVSDELADKIADFIARATETLGQQTPNDSEENIKDNSQVSAENRMFNIEQHDFERVPAGKVKSKGDNAGKDKVKTPSEKKKPTETEDTDTKSKPRTEKKRISRYIVDSDKKDSSKPKQAGSKDSEEDNYKKMKDSIKFIENNLLGATDKARTKKPKQKKNKMKPYKLLSNFDSHETNAAKEDTTGSKDKKGNIEKRSQRSFDDEIAAIRKAALEYDDEDNKHAAKIPALVRDGSDNNGIEITNKTQKVAKSGSSVIEKDDKEEKWWENDLPKHNQDDANLKRKSWF